MRFSRQLETEVIAAIKENRHRCVVFSKDMYRDDSSIVIYRDNVSMLMHRYLHTQLIGPLTRAQFLLSDCKTTGCMNPYHRKMAKRPSSTQTRTSCPKGHEYTVANTLTEGRARCRMCRDARLARRRRPGATARGVCREGHKLTPANVYTHTDRNGQVHRRCKTCTLAKTRARRAQPNGDTP